MITYKYRYYKTLHEISFLKHHKFPFFVRAKDWRGRMYLKVINSYFVRNNSILYFKGEYIIDNNRVKTSVIGRADSFIWYEYEPN